MRTTLAESAVAKRFLSGDQASAKITLPKVATAMERTNVQLFLCLFHCQFITWPPALTARAFPSGDHAKCFTSFAFIMFWAGKGMTFHVVISKRASLE